MTTDTRPNVRLGVDIHRVADEAIAALQHDRTLYQRDAKLVHVVRAEEPDDYIAAGTPQMRDVAAPQLKERLSREAKWERFDARSKTYVPAKPPGDVVAAVLDRCSWPTVRPLAGVIETPSMRPDGSVIQSPGYDRSTGWLYQPSAEYPAVRDAPTQSEANDALIELCEVWCDVPWSRDVERYVPVAAVMTVLARPAIRGAVPGTGLDASTRGSGKTLVADTIATIAIGRDAPRMAWPSDEAELAKTLGAYAIRGARLIAWDNITGVYGGGPLDAVLTATDRVELRVLGVSEVHSLAWRAVMLATANNLQLGADTVRRVLIARIEPECERPEERTDYRHPDLLAWCREHRPRLVTAALTVLRGYVAAGRPDMGLPRWGSYDAWTALIPQAIRWAGGSDVLACRGSADDSRDTEAEALRTVLVELKELHADGCTARTVAETLWPGGRTRGEDRAPDRWDTLRDALELVIPCRPGMAPTARQIGTRLRGWRGRVVGGRRLVQAAPVRGTRVWYVDEVGS